MRKKRYIVVGAENLTNAGGKTGGGMKGQIWVRTDECGERARTRDRRRFGIIEIRYRQQVGWRGHHLRFNGRLWACVSVNLNITRPLGAQRGSRPEQQIQRAVFEHLAVRAASTVFAFHPANGGWRSRVEAAILKGSACEPGSRISSPSRAARCYALELKRPAAA